MSYAYVFISIFVFVCAPFGCSKTAVDRKDELFADSTEDEHAAVDEKREVFTISKDDEDTFVRANNAFAIALFHKLAGSRANIFFSPYSVSDALAMTYAGARGDTEKQMAKALRFSLPAGKLHKAFAGVESMLSEIERKGHVNLRVADSLWPQKDFKLRQDFLSFVKRYYGVSIHPVDFKNATEDARKVINKWVEKKTQNRIQELIKPGVLTKLTRLVLVNAIWFKGRWKRPFKPSETMDRSYYLSPSEKVQLKLMKQKEHFKYTKTEDLQIIQLPYAGDDLSMIILLPAEIDGLGKLENNLTMENLRKWESLMNLKELVVYLPKFKMTSMFKLDDKLKEMGMIDAFSESNADFSGMDGKPSNLFIGAVIHKAFVDVYEQGTEAAASTAVHIRHMSMDALPEVFSADHPFIFLIKENRTGSILFLGRVVDPRET